MGFGLSSTRNLQLFTLLLILLSHGTDQSRKMNNESPNMKDHSEMIFFTEKDLKMGNKIPIYFPKDDPSKSPHLLPRDEASSIPFSTENLPNLLSFLSLPQDSPQAKAMEYTTRTCESEPILGETKLCATSLESMLDFVRGVFGSDVKFGVVSTVFRSRDGSISGLRNYTVLENPEEISTEKMVACHTLPYPYVVYYCHWQRGANKLYKISLGVSGDVAVEAVAVCHGETSHWSRDHAAFRVLGIEPGKGSVCHFFPADNLVWFSKHNSA